jgi:hypothetical protein
MPDALNTYRKLNALAQARRNGGSHEHSCTQPRMLLQSVGRRADVLQLGSTEPVGVLLNVASRNLHHAPASAPSLRESVAHQTCAQVGARALLGLSHQTATLPRLNGKCLVTTLIALVLGSASAAYVEAARRWVGNDVAARSTVCPLLSGVGRIL